MNIDKCPKCGSNAGYYIKHQTGGSMKEYYNFEGVKITEVIVTNNSIKRGSIGYCVECDKAIMKNI